MIIIDTIHKGFTSEIKTYEVIILFYVTSIKYMCVILRISFGAIIVSLTGVVTYFFVYFKIFFGYKASSVLAYFVNAPIAANLY